jgi:hypothetical protein
VRITEATDGACTGGFGGGPGGGPGGGADGEQPEGMPTDMPTDLPEGGRGFGGGAFGQVTAVSATGFTVTAQDETTVEVSVGDATSYTTTVTADASAVAVDRCATALGDTDDTGAVTATSIAVSDPVDGECQIGRGGFRGGAPGQDAS